MNIDLHLLKVLAISIPTLRSPIHQAPWKYDLFQNFHKKHKTT
jgi:hypothetical protein